MSTRTIEPIHVVLPDAEGGYYRFGDLPRLIADALYLEHPDDDDEAQELQWMKHAIDGVEKYKRDLARAAGLTDGEPGYLHVVENSASKRPLELRTGAVLDAGLVHLDWLNEWGESRKPPHVFSTASAPEPQAAAPAPVVAECANDAPVDGITTAQVAAIFDGIKYRAENWTRRLSDTKWLEPAKVALGAQGGASSLWNPATLARLIHGKERGTAKQKTLEALNRKFKSKPVLAPWRTAWDEHYDMFKDADGRH